VVARACSISQAVTQGALGSAMGAAESERRVKCRKARHHSNEVLIEANEWVSGRHGVGRNGQHLPGAQPLPAGRIPAALTHLDGSSNIDVNVSIGTIFSVLKSRWPRRVQESDFTAWHPAGGRWLLRVRAATTLVLTVGDGVAMFTLDREQGSFVLTEEHVRIPEDTKEFAINMSNMRHWDTP
jgi:fructose-1,6-bisphosphatase I